MMSLLSGALSKSGSIFSLVYALAIFALGYGLETYSNQPAKAGFEINLPLKAGDWQGTELEGLGIREKNILRLDDHIRRTYKRSDGSSVFVYIGYWKTQSGDYQAAKHSPKTCLPSNGWNIVNTGSRLLDPENDLQVATITGEFKTSTKLTKHYNYWFFSGEEVFFKEWLALAKIVKEKLLHGRSDGGIVEIAATAKDSSPESLAEADQVLSDFYQTFSEHLRP